MASTTGATPPLTILVVDDEMNIRKTLTVCLETEGHRVAAVGNFQDAVSEGSRRSFDLAFVDLRLGTASGLDLIPAKRRRDRPSSNRRFPLRRGLRH